MKKIYDAKKILYLITILKALKHKKFQSEQELA